MNITEIQLNAMEAKLRKVCDVKLKEVEVNMERKLEAQMEIVMKILKLKDDEISKLDTYIERLVFYKLVWTRILRI